MENLEVCEYSKQKNNYVLQATDPIVKALQESVQV